MGKVKEHLLNDLMSGWLSPDGSFYPCVPCEHVQVARVLCDKFGYNIWDYQGHADDTLMQQGWALITLSEWDKHWRIDWKWTRKVTPQQVKFLRPYFEDAHPVHELIRRRWEREVESVY